MRVEVNPKFLEDEKIIVRYYRTEKHGSVTVCGRYIENQGGDKFEIGVAFCSPIEKQFDKQFGKVIALGRLLNGRSRGYIWTIVDDGEELDSVIFRLLYSLQDPVGAERIRNPRLKSARWFGEFLKEIQRQRREHQKEKEREKTGTAE